MRGPASWQVVEDEPEDLHLVLFVRDSFRLSVDAPVPGPLTPPVPDLGLQVDEAVRSAAATGWPGWWRDAMDRYRRPRTQVPPAAQASALLPPAGQVVDPPDFQSLMSTPELGQVARRAFVPFLQWWSPPLPPTAPIPRRQGRPLGLRGVRGRLIDTHLRRRTVQDVVSRIESDIGRPASPFEFRIYILAVTEPDIIVTDDMSAVISIELVRTEHRYRDWLDSVLRPLAQE